MVASKMASTVASARAWRGVFLGFRFCGLAMLIEDFEAESLFNKAHRAGPGYRLDYDGYQGGAVKAEYLGGT
jgi:hypothetical protein